MAFEATDRVRIYTLMDGLINVDSAVTRQLGFSPRPVLDVSELL